jgi:hypothetical protein
MCRRTTHFLQLQTLGLIAGESLTVCIETRYEGERDKGEPAMKLGLTIALLLGLLPLLSRGDCSQWTYADVTVSTMQ